jgi:penicillin-binding protein 2
MGDLTGKFGLEKKYEKYLRGYDGIRAVEIDARGRIRTGTPLEQISTSDLERKAVQGLNIKLSIDLDIEKVAYNVFGEGEAGSLVAMNTKNGEIIAMVSKPSFDPSLFAGRIERKIWDGFNQDPNLPLMDRAIRGQYPPGSVFKIIVAIAALEEKEIDQNTNINCGGGVQFANRFYRCWKKEGHGVVNVRKGLVQSCDSFFYRVGLKVGVDRIAKYAKMLGLGERSGILLNNEKSGLIPSSEWKKRFYGEKWYDGETLSTSIGQGYNQVTTLQLARMISAIANKGKLFVPKLLLSVSDINNNKIDTENVVDEEPEIITISEKTWKIIHEALAGVMNEPGGTAYWSGRMEKYIGAGKTGTAQVVKMASGERVKSEELDYRYRDHALFVAFAPVSDPEIGVAVITEHGGHGSSAAAPKAKAVIEAYLNKMHPEVVVTTKQTGEKQ